jgi:hypothetical protein
MPEAKKPISDDPWDKNNSLQDLISSFNLSQPAYVIALFTAFFYVMVIAYYIPYFKVLNISFFAFDLPFSFYLYVGFKTLIGMAMLIPLLFVLFEFDLKIDTSISRIKRVNEGINFLYILVFLTLIILPFICVLIIEGSQGWILVSPMILFYGVYYFFKYVNDYFKKRKYPELPIYIRIIVTIFISLSVISSMGMLSAYNLILDNDNPKIRFDLNENNSILSNKTFNLVMHSESKYYLIERNASNRNISNSNNIYIVPDSQIKSMIIESSNLSNIAEVR